MPASAGRPTLICKLASPPSDGERKSAGEPQPEGQAVANISHHGNKLRRQELWMDGAQGKGKNSEMVCVCMSEWGIGGGGGSQGCYVHCITWVASRCWGRWLNKKQHVTREHERQARPLGGEAPPEMLSFSGGLCWGKWTGFYETGSSHSPLATAAAVTTSSPSSRSPRENTLWLSLKSS